ncbi:MAG: hypothetical protein U0P45_09180 [Acidimicrobiales bacterium]
MRGVVALVGLLLATLAVGAEPAGAAATASADGDLMAFGPVGGATAGLRVWVLEDPSITTTTGASGHWHLDGIPVGSAATFALEGDVRYPIQTATFTMPPDGLERVSFQSPNQTIVAAFESVLGIQVDPARCVIAATVTRRGYSLYHGGPDGTHGEPGATVSISPRPAAGGTPIYFNGSKFDVIWPDRSLRETTPDGGVLFVNVTPGTYVLSAHKAGATIRSAQVGCRPGVLTNAAPPWGLQVTEGGLGLDEVVPFPTAAPTTTSTSASTTSLSVPAAPITTSAAAQAPAAGAVAVPGDPGYAG